MADEFPKLMWQREYNKRWTLYSFEEICIINKAVDRRNKTVTLPSNDSKKKIHINFEKMIQKNVVSGYEQHIRCLIYNDGVYFSWSWKDDFDVWISYPPRVIFFLEVAYEKRMKRVDIFLKDDYEIDLQQFCQINKQTQFVRSVMREKVSLRIPANEKATNALEMLQYDLESTRIVKEMAEGDIDRLQNYLFGLPTTELKPSDAESVSSSVPDEIITALNIEAQASTSASTSTTIAVDPDCPEAKNYIVYSENEDIYNATLNFTNLQDNNNKFFIIQLIKCHNKNKYAVWFHWGRVGYKGQNNLINFGSNLEGAKSAFEKKFFDKTRNHWSERNNFEKVASKYDLVHSQIGDKVISSLPIGDSQLDIRIQNLLELICNRNNLEEAAKELCFDLSKIPLGKITARQIVDGYNALYRISDIIKSKGKGKDLVEACNNFYTKIPHDFGRKTPELISTFDKVKDKMKMLEDLSNICLAVDLLSSTGDASMNIIDKYYRSLECNLIPLDHTSDKFKALAMCLSETHGPTHSSYTMELVEAFSCMKDSQESTFCDMGNKKLLWHGSRISNWMGILKKGLQIAPPEAPVTGYMFGKGVYFADISSKSANYCFATKKKNEGLLLLSEVSLGNSFLIREADDFSNIPEGYSVCGLGRIKPSRFELTVLSSDAYVPLGPLCESSEEDLSLNYNEYIVYHPNQVKMKYLLRIKFNFK